MPQPIRVAPEQLASLPVNPWTGAGADAAKQALDQTIRALQQDADQSLVVAKSLDAAADDIQNLMDTLGRIYQTATAQGLVFDPVSNTITPGKLFVTPQDRHNAQVLQDALNALLLHGRRLPAAGFRCHGAAGMERGRTARPESLRGCAEQKRGDRDGGSAPVPA